MKISKGTIALFAGEYFPLDWALSQGHAKVFGADPPNEENELKHIVCLDSSDYVYDWQALTGLVTTIEENEEVPWGWALCNGFSMEQSENEILFSIIEYRYGGSGNNFNLPRIANLGTKRYIICIDGISLVGY